MDRVNVLLWSAFAIPFLGWLLWLGWMFPASCT